MTVILVLQLLKAAQEALSSDKCAAAELFRQRRRRALERVTPIKFEVCDFNIFTPGGK